MSNLKVALYLLAIPIIAIATGFTMTVLTDIGNRKMNEHMYNDATPQCTCEQNNR